MHYFRQHLPRRKASLNGGQDVLYLKDVPLDFPLTDAQRNYVTFVREEEMHIDTATIQAELENLVYPLYFSILKPSNIQFLDSGAVNCTSRFPSNTAASILSRERMAIRPPWLAFVLSLRGYECELNALRIVLFFF